MYFTDITEIEKSALVKVQLTIIASEKYEGIRSKEKRAYFISTALFWIMYISIFIIRLFGCISSGIFILLTVMNSVTYSIYSRYWRERIVINSFPDEQTLLSQIREEYKVLHIPAQKANLLSYQEIIDRLEHVGINFAITKSSDNADVIRSKIKLLKELANIGLFRANDEEICLCISKRENLITDIIGKE